jgi:small subunit ribosomal protein S20
MAHTLSAQKRVRQNLKRRLRNQSVKSRIKTQIKKIKSLVSSPETSAITDGDKKTLIVKEITLVQKLIDKAVNKGIIHKNKGARLKSRLMKAVSSE